MNNVIHDSIKQYQHIDNVFIENHHLVVVQRFFRVKQDSVSKILQKEGTAFCGTLFLVFVKQMKKDYEFLVRILLDILLTYHRFQE